VAKKTSVEILHDFIMVSVPLYGFFVAHGKVGMEACQLYNHYFYTARLQQTNRPWANDSYLQKGLRWGEAKVDRAKKFLIEHGLIKVERGRDEKGRLTGKTYITLLNMPKSSLIKDSPSPDFSNAGIKGTNAYKEKLEMLKKKETSEKPSSRPLADPVAGSPKVREIKSPEEVEYQDLREPPFSFSRSTINKLLSLIEEKGSDYTLDDYAQWWLENYHGKESTSEKPNHPFALVYDAIQKGHKLWEYDEWGHRKTFEGVAPDFEEVRQ